MPLKEENRAGLTSGKKFRTDEGEALRTMTDLPCVAAWEFTGGKPLHVLHREELVFTILRSVKEITNTCPKTTTSLTRI